MKPRTKQVKVKDLKVGQWAQFSRADSCYVQIDGILPSPHTGSGGAPGRLIEWGQESFLTKVKGRRVWAESCRQEQWYRNSDTFTVAESIPGVPQ